MTHDATATIADSDVLDTLRILCTPRKTFFSMPTMVLQRAQTACHAWCLQSEHRLVFPHAAAFLLTLRPDPSEPFFGIFLESLSDSFSMALPSRSDLPATSLISNP